MGGGLLCGGSRLCGGWNGTPFLSLVPPIPYLVGSGVPRNPSLVNAITFTTTPAPPPAVDGCGPLAFGVVETNLLLRIRLDACLTALDSAPPDPRTPSPGDLEPRALGEFSISLLTLHVARGMLKMPGGQCAHQATKN